MQIIKEAAKVFQYYFHSCVRTLQDVTLCVVKANEKIQLKEEHSISTCIVYFGLLIYNFFWEILQTAGCKNVLRIVVFIELNFDFDLILMAIFSGDENV